MRKIICVFFLMISVFAVSSCDSKTDKLYADCMVCEDSLVLDFNADEMYAGGHMTNFVTKMPVSEMCERINQMSVSDGTINASIYGDYIFIQRQSEDEHIHYYIIDPIKSKTGKAYNFSSVCTAVMGERILVPFHLIEMSHLDFGEIDAISEKQEYKLLFNKDVLLSFYQNAGIYDVEMQPNYLCVTVKNSLQTVEKSGYHTKCSFFVVFTEKENGTFVSWQEEKPL